MVISMQSFKEFTIIKVLEELHYKLVLSKRAITPSKMVLSKVNGSSSSSTEKGTYKKKVVIHMRKKTL